MGTKLPSRALAVLATAALATGCFGYNKPAKRWAYVADSLLLVGGGGVIALDVVATDEMCTPGPGMPCPYDAPLTGTLVAGAVLVAAGLFGILFNATRPNVKTSR